MFWMKKHRVDTLELFKMAIFAARNNPKQAPKSTLQVDTVILRDVITQKRYFEYCFVQTLSSRYSHHTKNHHKKGNCLNNS